MSDDDEAAMVRITGRVQGVGFRAWTREEAEQLGLTGWVRNEPDGSVLALLAGWPAAITQMLERLRQGPPGASVSGVERQPAALAQKPVGFRITR
ncbi:acylphosphatase [Neorhizobium galegae]|uniref:acylphosphatase n=1 Tax=Neorhizobium galegae TaxID=399 RepID=UPI0006228184|nr:acylphosphatase [Neorhizobium galegae]MCQ1764507.1 acylphosphatase [Neorhizobium galegae]MCQ1845788.1 acylphosphatase [Neorhizobium galegae]CDZ40715.1 Acylphosphatase [Neorhizobium galegae bv. officinalis]